MNKHFSVVNKRGTTVAGIIMCVCIVLFSLCLAMRISSGSVLWTIPLVACIIFFIIGLMVMISIITAGVDVKDGNAVFADVTGQGGKRPQFHLSQLKTIELHNNDGVIQNPETANLAGARIVFTLKNGEIRTYYPIQITAKQYENIKNGMMEMAKGAKREKSKPMTKAEKKAAVNAKSIKRIKEEEK